MTRIMTDIFCHINFDDTVKFFELNMVQFTEPHEDFDESSTENEIETILDQFQNRHNILQERFISFKALAETLKNQISNEKILWQCELKETVRMEKQIEEKHKVSADSLTFNRDEYKRKLDIFKEFLFFSQTSSNIQETLKKNNYQQWLSEIEIECNTELDKIRQSMTALKPLQAIACTWGKGDDHKDQINYDVEKQNVIPGTLENDDCLAEILENSQNYSQQSGDISERFSLISSD